MLVKFDNVVFDTLEIKKAIGTYWYDGCPATKVYFKDGDDYVIKFSIDDFYEKVKDKQ